MENQEQERKQFWLAIWQVSELTDDDIKEIKEEMSKLSEEQRKSFIDDTREAIDILKDILAKSEERGNK